jgi:toxin ParE1/3/4
MRLIVLPDARRDLKSIARYSEKEWDVERRDLYMTAFQHRFRGLLANPSLGVPRNDFGADYRSMPVGRHIIFYRLKSENLHILRVLHQRMDVKLHL